MKYCPICNKQLKVFTRQSFFIPKQYMIKCDNCNTKFSHTQLMERYNSIYTIVFFSIILVFFDDIQYYINKIFHNNFTSNVIIMFFMLIGFIIINNFNFPWTKCEVVSEKDFNKASTS